MRDPARIEPLLRLIKTLWLKQPDLRLGQLIFNAINPKGTSSDLFNVEDNVLRACLLQDLKGADALFPDPELVSFGDLWVGDRFKSGDVLWTKTRPDIARRHCKESVALGARGLGYIGDAICTFEPGDLVAFVPPSQD